MLARRRVLAQNPVSAMGKTTTQPAAGLHRLVPVRPDVPYGEKLLHRLEFKASRRRRMVLLTPALVAALWSLVDLLLARHERLTQISAPILRHAIDHAEPALWTVVVLALFFSTLKPKPLRAGVMGSIIAGPLAAPTLFGPGGWHPWQIGLFCASGLVTLLAFRRIHGR